MMDDQPDICRVCRLEGSPDQALFHPCVCTGSIKYVHQECLLQWLRYSRKEFCELCNTRFIFQPIYAPDMPKRLPMKDVVVGLVKSIATAIRLFVRYTVVAFTWLVAVPLYAYRARRLFAFCWPAVFAVSTGSVKNKIFWEIFSTKNLVSDTFYGYVLVICVIFLVKMELRLRAHILFHEQGPGWLGPQDNNEEGVIDEVVDEEGENAPMNAHAAINNNVNNNEPAPAEDVVANIHLPLTLNQILGLDGISLIFIEHVWFMTCFTTIFTWVFELIPYLIGHFTLSGLQLTNKVQFQDFERMLVTIFGHCALGVFLVILHVAASLLKLRKWPRKLRACYVFLKVCFMDFGEKGIFPLMCGWWLDICSLSLFDSTVNDRKTSFDKAPETSFFIHWIVGRIYIYSFAPLTLLLGEVLRPGVLWFLRDMNCLYYSPIQEMIHWPVLQHVRRSLFSLIILGTTILLMVWLPIRIIKNVLPSFLPYTVVFTIEQTDKLSLELVLLLVMVPALLEQRQAREWLKSVIRCWCIGISWVFDLRSYLLGDVPVEEVEEMDQPNVHENPLLQNAAQVLPEVVENPNDDQGAAPNDAGLGLAGLGFVIGGGLQAAHQALRVRFVGHLQTGSQQYKRPNLFPLKIFVLLLAMCITLTFVSVCALTIPVCIGRAAMSHWLSTDEPVHELYTAASGLYLIWLSIRLIILISTWLPRGWNAILETVRRWSLTFAKSAVAIGLLICLVPYLCGLLFELMLVSPLQVPAYQSPIYLPTENWVTGILLIKIICAAVMKTPNFWLRGILERTYNDGFVNINLTLIIKELAAPSIMILGIMLAIPYGISQSIVPIFVWNSETQNLVERRIYPYMLAIGVVLVNIYFQIHLFKKLYEQIKNDLYVVGRRLVNYERSSDNT